MALLESITTSSIWNNGCPSLHELWKVEQEQEGFILSFFYGSQDRGNWKWSSGGGTVSKKYPVMEVIFEKIPQNQPRKEIDI